MRLKIFFCLFALLLLPIAFAKGDLSLCFPEFQFGIPKKDFLAAYEEKGIELIPYLPTSDDTVTTENKPLNYWGVDADLHATFAINGNLSGIQINFIDGYEEIQHTETLYVDCAEKFINIKCNLESFLGKMTDGCFTVDGLSYNFPDDVSRVFAHASLLNKNCEIELSNGNVILSLEKNESLSNGRPFVNLILCNTEIYYSTMYSLGNFVGDFGDYIYK